MGLENENQDAGTEDDIADIADTAVDDVDGSDNEFDGLASLDVDLADDISPDVDEADAGEDDVTEDATASQGDQPDDGGEEPPADDAGAEDTTDDQPGDDAEVETGESETTEQMHERIAQDRKNAVSEMERSIFESLSEEDRSALMSEPEKVIPRLLAEAQVTAFERAVQVVFAQLPTMLESYNRNQETARNTEQQFFATHGEDLREHTADLQQAIAFVHQQNPQLKRNEVAAKAVQMVRALKGLTPQQQQAPAQTPASRRPPRPARPSVSSAPAASQQQRGDDNPFAELADIET